MISGFRIVGAIAWYWAALARSGAPLLHVADWHVPRRSDPLLVKGDGLWAEHTCDAPMEQWTVANETYAAALDDPDEALGRAYGVTDSVVVGSRVVRDLPTAIRCERPERQRRERPTTVCVAGERNERL